MGMAVGTPLGLQVAVCFTGLLLIALLSYYGDLGSPPKSFLKFRVNLRVILTNIFLLHNVSEELGFY